MKRALLIVVAAGVLAGCGSASEAAAPPAPSATMTIFETAAGRCGLSPLHGATVGDGGKTLTVDGKGEEDDNGVELDAIRCLLDVTEASDAVRSQIQQTRALDGRQQGSWGNIDASWSYHPDSGIEMVLTLKS